MCKQETDTINPQADKRIPSVSVIVPVYNAAMTIGKFIDSLSEQDYPLLETVFVDDGSVDSSVELLRARGYQPVISPHNQGQSLARNLGLSHTRGQLICFFDSDVILKPDTVSKLVQTLENYNCDAVSGNYETEPADRNLFSRFYSYLKSFGHGERVVLDHNILGTYCCIVRREYLEQVEGFRSFPPGMDIECEDVGNRLSRAGCRFVFDPGIRVGHHFGGFRKILYVFSNRVFWYVRYKFLSSVEKEALDMRGGSSAAAVAAYMLSSLSLPALLITGLLFPDRTWQAVGLVGLWTGGLAAGTLLMSGFLRFCRRRGGTGFALTAVFLLPFFFTVGGIYGSLGTIVAIRGKFRPQQDKLYRLLQT